MTAFISLGFKIEAFVSTQQAIAGFSDRPERQDYDGLLAAVELGLEDSGHVIAVYPEWSSEPARQRLETVRASLRTSRLVCYATSLPPLAGAVFVSLVYWVALVVRADVADVSTFQLLVNIPALYPLTAIAGAAVRGLLDKQAATEEALVEAERDAAVEHERARIAREMHDSLAKTIQGVALSASALAGWARKDPGRAQAEATKVAEAARAASGEARELLTDMRADMLDKPLAESVIDYVARWASSAGVAARCDADGVRETAPEVRWELFSIVREALRNVERHARASKVDVHLDQSDGWVVAEIRDDGVGFDVPQDLTELRGGGHFGVLGMSERAARVGGRLEVTSGRQGTTLRASVPQDCPTSHGATR